MGVSRYVCAVLGEEKSKADRLRPSTQRRMKAFAIAIHLPVLLWIVTGYVLATRVFSLPPALSIAIGAFCAVLVYLVERVILAAPKSMRIMLMRAMLGTVIALIGATAVDLTLFEREIGLELKQKEEERIKAEFDEKLALLRKQVDQTKVDLDNAQQAANCEANGTCGSRTRNIGPVYHALVFQVTIARQEYVAARERLQSTEREFEQAIKTNRQSALALSAAGILSRIEALHAFIRNQNVASVAWLLFFLLVWSVEMMVVISKWIFPETIDDRLDALRDQIVDYKAKSYYDALTSPFAEAEKLLNQSAY